MVNGLTVFENEKFGQVRTVEVNNEPWFVGKDVAEALGYSNPQEAVRNHVDEDDKGVSGIRTPGGVQKMPTINESGLYSLILSSKLPSAKEFKRWVTSEVLPALRKTGEYKSDKVKVPKLPLLSSINMAAKNLMMVYKAAGVDSKFTALAVSNLYNEKAGLHLSPPIVADHPKLYDKTGIANALGILSSSGKPHAQAVGAIIRKISISEAEMVKAPYEKNGHSGFDIQYTPSVVEKVSGWLDVNGWPTVIGAEGKEFAVAYRCEVA